MIRVEVVYATIEKAHLCLVEIEEGKTVFDAIQCSGVLTLFPEIDLAKQKVGIFSKLCSLDTPLTAGDRVEIYRPLVIEPKAARRLRSKNL